MPPLDAHNPRLKFSTTIWTASTCFWAASTCRWKMSGPCKSTCGANLKEQKSCFLEQQYVLFECQVALRNGVDLDLKVPDLNYETRLGKAIRKGWIEIVRWLLAHGADPNAESGWIGASPLHVAISQCIALGVPYSAECTALLLDAGALVDARDKDSYTALFDVAAVGECAMVKLLLSRGASVHTVTVANDNDPRWITHPNDPEAYARSYARDLTEPFCDGPRSEMRADAALAAADLLADVRAAGGWAAYVAAPRNQLLALRRRFAAPTLRLAPPFAPLLLVRLFLDPKVPEEIFTHVFTFWRCNRDSHY